jgi:hypothetical protein
MIDAEHVQIPPCVGNALDPAGCMRATLHTDKQNTHHATSFAIESNSALREASTRNWQAIRLAAD